MALLAGSTLRYHDVHADVLSWLPAGLSDLQSHGDAGSLLGARSRAVDPSRSGIHGVSPFATSPLLRKTARVVDTA